jgi:VWFA-related protein
VRVLLASTVLVLLSLARFHAQQQPSPASQTPTFRAEARYVEIDASITDGNGQFVRDLTQEDFEILEDGIPQTVERLVLVDVPVEPLERVGGDSAERLDTDVATNTGESRIYVMLLDCCGSTDILLARLWARRFVDHALGSHDIMAVVHAQGSRGDGQPFTGNARLLRASIDRYINAPILIPLNACEEVQRLRNTYQAVEDLSERLGAVSGRRKAILWVNGMIPFDANLEFGGGPAPAGPGGACIGGATAGTVVFMHRDAIRMATRNNVAIYPVDPAGLTIDLGFRELARVAALRAVAEDTGGEAVVGTNDFLSAFERVVRHNSTYYLIGYYSSVDRRDGRFRSVTVRVRRRGLSVRAKKGYFAPASDAVAADPRPLLEGLSADGRAALRSPAPVRGIGIDLVASPFRSEVDAASVVLAARLRGSDLRLAQDDEVEISYVPIDDQGRTGTGARKVFTLNLLTETRAHVERDGLRFVDRLQLPPGRHELRFAAHQPGWATGSVVTQIEVPDFTKDALAMSGVLLARKGTPPHGRLLEDESLSSLLGGDPTAVRRFTRDDEVSVFGEVYVNASIPQDEVDVTCTIAIGSGEVVMSEPAWPVVSGPVVAGRIGFTTRLELTELEPGDYVLTVHAASSDGRATAVRQIPFAVE